MVVEAKVGIRLSGTDLSSVLDSSSVTGDLTSALLYGRHNSSTAVGGIEAGGVFVTEYTNSAEGQAQLVVGVQVIGLTLFANVLLSVSSLD